MRPKPQTRYFSNNHSSRKISLEDGSIYQLDVVSGQDGQFQITIRPENNDYMINFSVSRDNNGNISPFPIQEFTIIENHQPVTVSKGNNIGVTIEYTSKKEIELTPQQKEMRDKALELADLFVPEIKEMMAEREKPRAR
jgi:hypothetical protein